MNGFSQTKTKTISKTTKQLHPQGSLFRFLPRQENGFARSPKETLTASTIKSDSTYRFAEYQPGVSTPESFGGK